LACYLTENNVKVSLVNPLSVKRFAQALMFCAKTDRADCRMLIEYGKRFNVKLWQPQKSSYIQMQQLLCMSSQLIKQQTAWNNQMEAINHSVVKTKIEKQLKNIEHFSDHNHSRFTDFGFAFHTRSRLVYSGTQPEITAKMFYRFKVFHSLRKRYQYCCGFFPCARNIFEDVKIIFITFCYRISQLDVYCL
jgi:hypothetical protein